MCIPCDKTFSMVPKVLTLWPCLWPLTYIYKTLTSVITFKQFEIGPLYFTCVFLMTVPFNWYQTFDLLNFTVTFDLYLQNLNLSQNFKTVTGRAVIFHMCIACAKTLPMVPKLESSLISNERKIFPDEDILEIHVCFKIWLLTKYINS